MVIQSQSYVDRYPLPEWPRLDPSRSVKMTGCLLETIWGKSAEVKIDTIKRAEWIVALLLSLNVLFLLIVRAQHAGALWRDEASSIQLAQMSSWGEIAENYEFDSFPFLFVAILRCYTSVFTNSDQSLRLFGLLVGAGLLGVAWFNSTRVADARDAPLLLPLLVGLNVTFLTIGTSIRGYGLGSVLIVFAFALTAKLLLRPSLGNFAAVFLAYLASAHCLFFNIAYIGAIALAAAIAFALRHHFRPAATIVGTAVFCGLSYIPYFLRYSQSRDWVAILSYPRDLGWLFQQLIATCGSPISIMPWAWLILLLFAIAGAGNCLRVSWRDKSAPEWNLLLFGLLAVLLAVPAHFAFAQLLHDPLPNPRYYLALICLLAASVDLIIANLARSNWLRLTRLTVASIGLIGLPLADWPDVTKRETNIDFVASHLNREAVSGDLILVNPWYMGVSFNRYYHGAARWITVPQMSDHRTHRYDLMKSKMLETDPLSDVRREIYRALDSGGRLWLVGGAALPEPGKILWPLPAPDPELGWSNQSYSRAWSMQLGEFLQQHGAQGEFVFDPDKDVDPHENIGLLFMKGWRD